MTTLYKMITCISRINNGWVIGCSLLTFGIITSSYLHGINEIQLLYMKYKHKKEMDLVAENYEDKLIAYYSKNYTIAFILGITGISLVAIRSTLALNK
jgi:hypothetical protein